MQQYYPIKVAGLERRLPLCPVNDNLSIAAFILFGDVEMTVACAKALLKKAPAFDRIFTPEAKSIPLAHEMSRQSGRPYAVARKGIKVYMRDPIEVEVQSITTQALQRLYVGADDVKRMNKQRVLLVDDVISTGESLAALRKLAELAGAEVVGECAVLAEGDAARRTDIFFLEKLPLFHK